MAKNEIAIVTATSAAGYSGTALPKKLGIKAGDKLFVHGAPQPYAELVAPLPDGVVLGRRIDASTRIVHLFATKKADLERLLRSASGATDTTAAIWASWPKRTAKVPADITEDVIRAVALPLGLVDIKVCAVDAVWSGLKLMVRKELRQTKRGK